MKTNLRLAQQVTLKLSHVIASKSNGIFAVGLVVLCCAFAAAFAVQSYLVGILGLAAVVAHNFWAWRQSELSPISPDSAKTAAKVGWWVSALALLSSLF